MYAAFFDLDGTLAVHNEPPAAADADAIRAFRAAGNLTFLCTGRSSGYLYDAVLDIGFDGIIAGAGAHITVGNDLLFRRFITYKQLAPILTCFEKSTHTLVFETEQRMVQLTPPGATHLCPYPRITTAAQWFAQYPDETVSKLTIYGIPTGECHRVLTRELSLIVHRTANYCEVLPAGCSKADGLRRVLSHFGIPVERSIAFGDSANDADMLKEAGIGIAMGNSVPEVQALADRVTLPLSQCGVAAALKAFY